MASSQNSSANKPSTAAENQGTSARCSVRSGSISPPSSPFRYVPQHATASSSSLTPSEAFQSFAGIDADGDPTQMGSPSVDLNIIDPSLFTNHDSMNHESLTANTTGGDGSLDDAQIQPGDEMNAEVSDLTPNARVQWDHKLNCPARPISAPCAETVNPGPLGPRTKCVCGELKGGKRVPGRHAKKWHYKGPKFTFDEKLGAYFARNLTALSTPFHTFELNGKTICQPVTVSKEDYANGKRGANLSAERTVPQCAHFPITGLASYNVPFVKGRISHRTPNAQCLSTRIQDQARFLCLIENEVRADGTVRRRMNIHAPPASWDDAASISHLNRWRAQFRQRKLGVTSRQARKKWSSDAMDYLVERLARDPTTYRAELARDVTKRFGVQRSEHAVSCAIDNHKLRPRAEELRNQWEAEGLYSKFGESDTDIMMDGFVGGDDAEESGESDDADVKMDESENEEEIRAPLLKLLATRNQAREVEDDSRDVKMSSWML